MKIKTLDLFSGIGGFTLGLDAAGGFDTIAHCEIEPFQRRVLKKHWPDAPIYEDVTKLTIRGLLDDGLPIPGLICGGFPCQDLSATGRQAGIGEDTRSGLFRHIIRLAVEAGDAGRKPYLVFENVTRLLSGPAESPGEWFGEFLHALASIRYDAEWFCLTAASIGAPHERDRIWIVAYPHEAQLERGSISRRVYEKHADFSDSCWGQDKPGMVRTSNGLPDQAHRVGALGNAVVPRIVQIIGEAIQEQAWRP
jgi:DNA (cytosine-5)-methyltransferase 1